MKNILLLLLLLPIALCGQQYTLDDLISHGMEHSWSMQKAGLGSLSSRSSLASARLNLLPEVDLGFNVKHDLYNPLAPEVSDLSSNARISVSKTISLNDDAWFNYKYARLDDQKAALTYSKSSSGYAYSVFSAYLEVLKAQKQLLSLQKNLEIQTRVWEQSKVLNQLGKNTAYDVKEAEIAVMNSRISILQLENTISTQRRQLFALVSLQDEGYELADLEPNPDFQTEGCGVENSTAVKLLKADIKRSELSGNQVFLGYFPRVNLGYNYDRAVSGQDFELDHYSGSHTISLNLSYSLWNPLRQSQVDKRSGIGLRLAKLELENQIDELRVQYETMNLELEYLQNLDRLYREKLDQSTEQIRIAEERYRLGLIELLELDKTRVEYINSDIQYNNNRYQILAKQEAINTLLSRKLLGKW